MDILLCYANFNTILKQSHVNINDKAEDVIRKVFIYLIEERDKDKMNPNINGNNQRYYMKHNI